ncbi:MlaD family protein [Mycobacterium vicinigordonae]|uniref:MCE family protein n=1 Tax=Mycobacterium vicinigordonae TaxID=1719132 RepID=A0A7D6I5F4_9MYCO|nr:MlaD family protein [Mycobacterium vicinigordonae]QLL07378.1 MCE family protein [Mycobacterium vicinigordonae]
MRLRDLLSFIAFGAMIAFAVGYIGSLGMPIKPPPDRTNLSMTVADVNGLVVGSNVLLRGVPVGKVSNIASSVDGATVNFYVDGHFRIPADCDVRLDNLSALGESYIGLIPRRPDGPVLRNGQHIAPDSVKQPPSITELAVSVVRVLNQLDPSAVERMIGEVDTALPQANSVLPNLARSGQLLRNTVADLHGHGRVLLGNFQTLLRNAGWLGPTLAGVTPGVQALAKASQAVVDGVGALVYDYGHGPENLYRLDHLVGRLQKLMDNNGGDFRVLGEAFLPKVKGIAGALLNFDPSQILANILAALPEDGAITLHVAVPQN